MVENHKTDALNIPRL